MRISKNIYRRNPSSKFEKWIFPTSLLRIHFMQFARSLF